MQHVEVIVACLKVISYV